MVCMNDPMGSVQNLMWSLIDPMICVNEPMRSVQDSMRLRIDPMG